MFELLKKHKVHLFIGLFGSGKTEIAINFSLLLNENESKIALVDLDVISPYFRVRDEIDFLEELGIKIVVPPRRYMYADVPIITGAVGGYVLNGQYKVVVDAAGEEDGAKVVGSLKPYFSAVNTAMYFIVNTKRPFMSQINEIIYNIQRIQQRTRLKINYLVSNTNLANETDEKIIKEGEEKIRMVSEELKIPVAFTVVPENLSHIDTVYPKFVIKRFMKPDFEEG